MHIVISKKDGKCLQIRSVDDCVVQGGMLFIVKKGMLSNEGKVVAGFNMSLIEEYWIDGEVEILEIVHNSGAKAMIYDAEKTAEV